MHRQLGHLHAFEVIGTAHDVCNLYQVAWCPECLPPKYQDQFPHGHHHRALRRRILHLARCVAKKLREFHHGEFEVQLMVSLVIFKR